MDVAGYKFATELDEGLVMVVYEIEIKVGDDIVTLYGEDDVSVS